MLNSQDGKCVISDSSDLNETIIFSGGGFFNLGGCIGGTTAMIAPQSSSPMVGHRRVIRIASTD